MYKIWDYTEKNKPKIYRQAKKDAAGERMTVFQSEDPEMPWYGRDPKEIKRDSRYKQLSRHEKDLFNRMTDELWISKGTLPDQIEYVASCLDIADVDEAKEFIEKCVALNIVNRHGGRIYVPELREQYVRAVIKSGSRDTTGSDDSEINS